MEGSEVCSTVAQQPAAQQGKHEMLYKRLLLPVDPVPTSLGKKKQKTNNNNKTPLQMKSPSICLMDLSSANEDYLTKSARY